MLSRSERVLALEAKGEMQNRVIEECFHVKKLDQVCDVAEQEAAAIFNPSRA